MRPGAGGAGKVSTMEDVSGRIICLDWCRSKVGVDVDGLDMV
jgi:hypothetical protein